MKTAYQLLTEYYEKEEKKISRKHAMFFVAGYLIGMLTQLALVGLFNVLR